MTNEMSFFIGGELNINKIYRKSFEVARRYRRSHKQLSIEDLDGGNSNGKNINRFLLKSG